MFPSLTSYCLTTPPVSTTSPMTSQRKHPLLGKPPFVGRTNTRSDGLPKFGRSKPRRINTRPPRPNSQPLYYGGFAPISLKNSHSFLWRLADHLQAAARASLSEMYRPEVSSAQRSMWSLASSSPFTTTPTLMRATNPITAAIYLKAGRISFPAAGRCLCFTGIERQIVRAISPSG
ncbi:hypothetical protein EV286_11938 [Rhizobium sp. BK251]|nr:hypothetical protein EV286_11938 [Rhizobium sp. BK251]